MKAFAAGLLIAATALAGSSSAATAEKAPSLRALPGATAPTLAGRGFASGERVTVTLVADHVYRASTRASARGTFTVRFPGLAPCLLWSATARGPHSGRLRLHSGPLDCRPDADPGGPPSTAPPVEPVPSNAPGPPAVSTGAVPVAGTGIAGTVRRGPIMPVCVAELPCDGPAAGATVEVADSRGTVTKTTTAGDGSFTVTVPPGSYTVTVVVFRATSVAVVVRAGAFTQVHLSVDTGIR